MDEIKEHENITSNGKQQILRVLVVYITATFSVFMLSIPNVQYLMFFIMNVIIVSLFLLTYKGKRYAGIILCILSLLISIRQIYMLILWYTLSSAEEYYNYKQLASQATFFIAHTYIAGTFIFSETINKYLLHIKEEKQKKIYLDYYDHTHHNNDK